MTADGRTLVRGGHLFDLDRPFEVGDVLIEGGAISRVGGAIEAAGARVIDAAGMIVMPGLINAHTHSNQSIEKGLCDALPLDAWMVVASYGGAGAALRPADLYVSTMVGAVEMLTTGTTAVLDCPRSPQQWFDEGMDQIMSAYVDVGMRANVAAQYSDLDFFDSLPMALIGEERPRARTGTVPELLGRIEPYLERWSGKHPRPGRCSDIVAAAVLRRAVQGLARARGHAAAGTAHAPALGEVAGPVGARATADRPSSPAARSGGCARGTSFAHAIGSTTGRSRSCAASEAGIVHNPVSNLKLGAGIAPVPAMLRAGVPVALGTDGASSNDSQNMFETLKAAALVQRPIVPQTEWPTAMDSLRMCWDGGARTLGQKIGRLASGFRADIVLLRTGDLRVAPKEQIANQLVYAELGRSVDTVLVDGEVVVRGGRVTTVDADAIRSDAQRLIDGIWSSLPARAERFAEVSSTLERLEREVRSLAIGFSRFCG